MAEDRTTRAFYAEQLTKRLHEVVIEEMPKGMGKYGDYWLPLVKFDREVIRLCREYEEGTTTRETLDRAAVTYLHAWREQADLYRNVRRIA